jgi:hypothetical protein
VLELEIDHFSQTKGAGASDTAEILNSLLLGQSALADAVRTFLAANARLVFESADELIRIEVSHRQVAAELRDEIVRLGSRPTDSARAWRAYTEASVESENIFGARTAFKVLLESEQRELEELEAALFSVPSETRRLLEERLLPRVTENVITLGNALARRFE